MSRYIYISEKYYGSEGVHCFLSCLRVYKKWSKIEANQGINPRIPQKYSITCLGYKFIAYYRGICVHLDFPVSCSYDFSLRVLKWRLSWLKQ
jgi:hypothetical protein